MTTSFKLRSAVPGLLLAGGAGMLLAFRLSSTSRRNSPKPTFREPEKPVDLERYLGLWYELGRLPNRFERGCEGVTAEYVARSGGIIDVVNTCREGSPAGTRRISRGRAKVVAGCGNAKLKVSFFGPFYLGNYWVLDHADDYAWSIVGEPSGRFLWILSRDPTPAEIYDELVDRARAWGYDMARFRRTRQPPA